jgi:hypothetical protein
MALTENTIVDKIEIVENGTVQVREATYIYRDGEEISKTYFRMAFVPGSDVSAQPQNIQDICNIAWTPEVIAAYKAQIEANKPSAE